MREINVFPRGHIVKECDILRFLPDLKVPLWKSKCAPDIDFILWLAYGPVRDRKGPVRDRGGPVRDSEEQRETFADFLQPYRDWAPPVHRDCVSRPVARY